MAEAEDRLMLRLEASLAKFEKQMARARKVGTDYSTDIERRFERSNRKMAQSAEHSAKAISSEMDRLRAKYDPLFRASKQYEAELEELNRALRIGAINNRTYGESLTALNARYTAAAVGSKSLSTQGKTVTKMTPGLQAGIQNAAYQVGDFAVQVGAGTAASKALGMQMPQLLQGFGVLGAVMGAAVAIALPLAGAFLDLGDAGEDFDDKLEKLRSSVDEYRNSVRQANLPTAELAEKYGTATKAAREFLSALQGINNFKAQQDVNAMFSDLSEGLGQVDRLDSGRGGGAAYQNLVKISEQLGVSIAKVRELQPYFAALGNAKGAEEQVRAARDLLGMLEKTLGPYEEMSEKGKEIYENALAAGDAVAQLVGAADSAGNALSGAASQAGRLADEIGRAVDNAIALAAQGISDLNRAQIEWEFRDDPIGKAGALAGARLDEQVPWSDLQTMGQVRQFSELRDEIVSSAVATEQLRQKTIEYNKEQAKQSRKSSRGGGGGGSKKEKESIFASSDDQLLRLERNLELLGKTDRQVAELEARWQLLDAAKERGLSLDMQIAGTGETVGQQIERQAEAVGRLTEKYNEAKDRAEYFEGIQADIKDGLLDAIVAGEDFAGVLEDVAKSLAKAALNAVLFNEGPFSSGEGSGLFGGIFSALGGILKSEKGNAFGSSGVKPFAKGGAFTNSIVSSPTFFKFGSGGKKTGVMGEKDEEAVMPLVRAANGDLGVRAVREARQAEERRESVRVVYVDKPTVIGATVTRDGGLQTFVEQQIDSASGGIVRRSVQATGAAMRKTKQFGNQR